MILRRTFRVVRLVIMILFLAYWGFVAALAAVVPEHAEEMALNSIVFLLFFTVSFWAIGEFLDDDDGDDDG